MNKFNCIFPLLVVCCLAFHPACADPIHDSAKAGDVQKVQQLLSSGIDINVKDGQEFTALHWAAFMGRDAVAKLLVEKGANIDEVANGITPLHLAARKSAKVATLLMSKGAQPEPMDMQFLLGMAAFEGDIKTINMLLGRGVDINAQPYEEDSGNEEAAPNALTNAILGARANIVELLIKHGASIDSTHVGTAICSGKVTLVQLLVKHGAQLDTETLPTGYLANAVSCSNKEVLAYLMSKIAKPDYASISSILAGNSAKISPELFEILFANDAEINLHAQRLLQSATLSGNFKLAVLLYAKGVTLRQEESDSALLYAAQSGLRDMVELLLKHGTNVDARSDWGNTPLSRAAPYNHIEVVALLLQSSADANAKNELFNTPLHLSAARNLTEMSALLINNGARVNAINEDGNTPLHQAVRFPLKFDSMKLLLGKNAKVNAQNKRGMTALHYLAIRNTDYKDYDESPPQKNANLDVQEVQSWQRPEGWGRVEEDDRINAIKLLISGGADLNIKNIRGESALDLERKYSKTPEFVRFLEESVKGAKP